MAKKGGASVNGRKIPHTPISVDYFQRGLLPSRTLYFLTHLHTDHIYGLDSSFDQTIYCTPLTKQLLLLQLSLNPDLFVELEYDEPRQIHIDCPGHVVITVTAVDSCHCPGSAMYLFQGYFGTILHTGDFRLTPELLSHPLLKDLEPDVLYLDNTYNRPIFNFPERHISCTKITEMVRSNPHLRTILAFNKLGKEEILVDIVKHTSYMIGVSLEQYRKMEVIGLSDICSLESDQCQVIVVPFHSVTEKNITHWMKECPSQIIVPTCRYIGRDFTLNKHPAVTVVYHSDHCSYNELYQFVELVKPVSIQPIVQRSDVCNVSQFAPLLSSREPIEYEIPPGIKNLLYSKYNTTSSQSFVQTSHKHPFLKRPLKKPKGVQFISPKKPKINDNDSSIRNTTEVIDVDNDEIPTDKCKAQISDNETAGGIFESKQSLTNWFNCITQQLAHDQERYDTSLQINSELLNKQKHL